MWYPGASLSRHLGASNPKKEVESSSMVVQTEPSAAMKENSTASKALGQSGKLVSSYFAKLYLHDKKKKEKKSEDLFFKEIKMNNSRVVQKQIT